MRVGSGQWSGASKSVFCFALCAMFFAVWFPVYAQQPAKLPKIGWLAVRPASAAFAIESFQREFGKLGYVEGKNIDSLARPGGNITGFTTIVSVLAGKRLELLKETIPKLSRVAVLWNPQDLSSVQSWKESQLPARELGLQLHSMEVSSADQYETAFKRAIKARSGALVWMASPLNSANQRLTVDRAEKYRLPAIYVRRAVVENGGLMSYGVNLDEAFRRAAVFVDKILKGTKPADIPVEQPTKFELVINLRTAKQIDLTIPPNVLARADRVIK